MRKNLQTLLLKKFLNYNEDSRSKVPIEQLVMSMVRDVVDATVEGYVVVLDLFSGALLKILYLILAMVYLQTRSGNGINVVPLLAVLVLPILIMAFLLNRQEQVFELDLKCVHRIMSWKDYRFLIFSLQILPLYCYFGRAPFHPRCLLVLLDPLYFGS